MKQQDQDFNLALQHHQSGRLREAEQLYRQVLAEQPAHAGAMHFLGVMAHQQGRNDLAIDLIRQSITLKPHWAEAHNNLALALQSSGQIDAAIASCREALRLKPDFPGALYNLGTALKTKGGLNEAIAGLRRAVALLPTYAEAHNALAVLLMEQGHTDDAIAAFRQAIALRPAFAEAHTNLGSALKNRRQFDEAIAAHRQAIALNPKLAEAHNNLGTALDAAGRTDQAMAAYRAAIACRSNFAEAHSSLGELLRSQKRFDEALASHQLAIQANTAFVPAYIGLALVLRDMGRLEEARHSLEQALRIEPDSKQIAFELAALSGDNSVPSPPPTMVRALFDQYALRFDDHLVKTLEYQAPQQLRAAIQSICPRTELDVLDLGCGTGLCGVELRPMAKRLVGVDLSPGMLERSAARGIYDQLIEDDITQTLLRTPDQWDLIVAGDVMIYVGDLAAVMSAAAAALRPGGWLAFTVERHEGTGFFLNPSFRYSHSLDYVRQLASGCELKEALTQEVTIRLQAKTPVAGWIVILNKPRG
jgi:predicted TPR repeat methyltransferase